MSFDKNLEKLLNSYWKRPEEQALVNKMKAEEANTPQEVNQIIKDNNEAFELTSNEFKLQVKNLSKIMENKIQIQNGYESWNITVEDNFVLAETKSGKREQGIIKEGFIQWDNYFAIPYIVRTKLDESALAGAFNENDTSNMSVYDNIVVAKPIKRKHSKPIIDLYDDEDEQVAKVTLKKFKESVEKFYNKKYNLISENFETAKKNFDLIVECEGETYRVLIPKKSFENFIIDNCITESYLTADNKLLTEKFMGSRNLNVKSIYLREFIENEMFTDESEGLEVSNVKKINDNTYRVNYVTENEPKSIDVSVDELNKFILNTDQNAKNQIVDVMDEEVFDYKSYFAYEDTAMETVKQYLLTLN